MLKNLKAVLAACSVAVVAASPAFAGTIALDSTRTVGNQNWNGALGMDFDVNAPIFITHLGAFDSGQNGFAGSVDVGIFDRNTQMLVGTAAVLTTANTSPGGTNNRFIDIADFVLGVGQYSIVAQFDGSDDPNGNVGFGGTGPTIDTGGGLISFVGGSRYDFSTQLVYPTIPDGGPSNRYDAGTFQFTAVPEPHTLALVGLALLGLGAGRRRR